jgi:hypothetical protein
MKRTILTSASKYLLLLIPPYHPAGLHIDIAATVAEQRRQDVGREPFNWQHLLDLQTLFHV